eukprot:791992-Amphidinium_carterae.1
MFTHDTAHSVAQAAVLEILPESDTKCRVSMATRTLDKNKMIPNTKRDDADNACVHVGPWGPGTHAGP